MKAIDIMSALAQPTRLEVFRLLARAGAEGMTSGDLATRAGAAANTMSAHLAVLSRAGLVSGEKDGRRIVYRASPQIIDTLTDFLADIAAAR